MSNAAFAIDTELLEDVFDEIKLQLNEYNIKSVADASGVSAPTLYFWMDGTTKRPYLWTITAVAQALGYRLVLVPGGTRKKVKRPTLRRIK